MEVIIHGKPLDASERFSSGIDKELARKIIEEFFAIGSVKESEALIVDARNWKGTWNSVYTLLLSQNVKDCADRGSYFAVSLIIPQKYCCLISEVYKLLENVVRENVLGVYLNKNLKYIVSNFDDSVAFEKLCSKLESSYVNLEKTFDSSFKPQVLNNDAYCSIHDCDSLSVIQLLKNKGRVIITENTETKDSLAAQSMKYYQMVQKAQGEIQQKNAKINELESQLSQMENAARQANTSASGKVRELKLKISELENDVKILKTDKQNAESALSDLKKILAQAAPFLEKPEPSHRNQKAVKQDGGRNKCNNERVNINRYLPLLNTLLLVLVLGFFVSLSFKGCSDSGTVDNPQMEEMKDQIKEKDQIIDSLMHKCDSAQQTFNEGQDDFVQELQNNMNDLLSQLDNFKKDNDKLKKQNNELNNQISKLKQKAQPKSAEKVGSTTQQAETKEKK